MRHVLGLLVVAALALGCGGGKAKTETISSEPAVGEATVAPDSGECCCSFTEGDRTGRHEMDLDDMEVRERMTVAECGKLGACVEIPDDVCAVEPSEDGP